MTGDSFWSLIIPIVGTNLVAVIAGVFTIWAGRRKAQADIQTVINAGFTELVDTLRAQVKFQNERIAELEGEMRVLRKHVR